MNDFLCIVEIESHWSREIKFLVTEIGNISIPPRELIAEKGCKRSSKWKIHGRDESKGSKNEKWKFF